MSPCSTLFCTYSSSFLRDSTSTNGAQIKNKSVWKFASSYFNDERRKTIEKVYFGWAVIPFSEHIFIFPKSLVVSSGLHLLIEHMISRWWAIQCVVSQLYWQTLNYCINSSFNSKEFSHEITEKLWSLQARENEEAQHSRIGANAIWIWFLLGSVLQTTTQKKNSSDSSKKTIRKQVDTIAVLQATNSLLLKVQNFYKPVTWGFLVKTMRVHSQLKRELIVQQRPVAELLFIASLMDQHVQLTWICLI